MGVNSLSKTVTRQRRGCDLNPGPSAPESSTLTTRLSSHPMYIRVISGDTQQRSGPVGVVGRGWRRRDVASPGTPYPALSPCPALPPAVPPVRRGRLRV